MKTIILISSLFILVVMVIQAFSIISSNKTERQKYSVVAHEGAVEIRFYPEATMATVYSGARTYKELSGPGFRKLANYIFGGNQDKTQIPMTAPVHMIINDTGSAMSFVMPSTYDQNNLPLPNDSTVLIQKTPEEYVAVISFGGFTSDREIKLYSEKLKYFLEEKQIAFRGNFRFLGYNPPYQLVGRRNEIIVSVDWNSNSKL